MSPITTNQLMGNVCAILLTVCVYAERSSWDPDTCEGSMFDRTRYAPNSSSYILLSLLQNYDNLNRPDVELGIPTKVICDIYINSFASVNVNTMDFSTNVYMRQSWKDSRLAYGRTYPGLSKLSLNSKFIDRLWVPDLLFSNEKSVNSHCITVPNRLVTIGPDGTILYSARYTLLLACQMNLQYFPLDKQQCQLQIESDRHGTEEVLLHWKPLTEGIPVEFNDMLELSQFELTNFTTENCYRSYKTGNFTCLRVVFNLKRQYGVYIIQNFIPSVLIVLMSWVSFWVNIDAVSARISLGVLTVLTMTTQSVGVWMSLPRVSYIKAVDIWMSACILFVFSAALEFAFVNTLARKEIRRLSLKLKVEGQDKEHAGDILKRITEEHTYGLQIQYDPNSRMLARKTDKISRILFPVTFVLVNLICWCVLLTG